MTVIDLQEYMKNKKSIIHAPIAKNDEILRSALCYELEHLLRRGGFPSVRVLYHKNEYIFVLNTSFWTYFKIKLTKFLGIFSWKDAMLASIKGIDKSVEDVKIYRTWPSAKKIQSILNS